MHTVISHPSPLNLAFEYFKNNRRRRELSVFLKTRRSFLVNVKKIALILWTNGNDGWKGTIQAGDVPKKIVFVDRANRGNPKGIELEENRLFLVEITGETKPGERKGVLFVRPIRPARFGWIAVGEPISGFRRHEWRCVEEGFEDWSHLGGTPTNEPEENRQYREVKDRREVFQGPDPWKVFALFGMPDRTESSKHNTVRFFWNGVGDRCMDPNRLLYGGVGLDEPKLPGEKRLSWEEATRAWEAEYVPGTLSKVPEGWNPVNEISITGTFRLCRFPEVTFSPEVLSGRGSWISCPDKLWELVPAAEQREIAERMRRSIPSPEQAAEETFSVTEPVRKLFEAEKERASFEAPGEIGMETVSSRQWVSYPESDDGFRSGGCYETWVTRRVISWGLSGEERQKLFFSQEVSEEGMLQGAREILEQASEYARKEIRELARNNPYRGCLKFVPESDREKWESAYGKACERIIEKILREGKEAYELEVSRRQGIVAGWEAANTAHERAVRAFEEARNIFYGVRADLYELDETLKEFPLRSYWQSPEDEKEYSAELAEWAEAIMEDIRARATDCGFRLVNGKLDKLPPKDPKEREKIDRIRRQAGMNPLPNPQEEGGQKPASADLLAALAKKFGGK